jgi:hypothetical protein
MRKYALGATLVAAGMVFHALPASADKLDEVLSRLDALEKRDSKLAAENAALKARLNKVETSKPKSAAPAISPAVGAVIATRTPTPPPALEAPEIDKNGHGFLEHKKGNPLTFYTPGGEITGYGNIDISFDDTTKSLTNMNLNGASPPVGNFGWLPAISTNTSYLGVRGFQRIENFPFNFVYQLELGFDVSATPGLKLLLQPQYLCRFREPRIRCDQDRQDDRAVRKLHRRLQPVCGPDRRHARHHGQHRWRQPRRIRNAARSLDLV